MRAKTGQALFPLRGVILLTEPVSQYRYTILPKTDDNDRAHKNDANTLSWQLANASF